MGEALNNKKIRTSTSSNKSGSGKTENESMSSDMRGTIKNKLNVVDFKKINALLKEAARTSFLFHFKEEKERTQKLTHARKAYLHQLANQMFCNDTIHDLMELVEKSYAYFEMIEGNSSKSDNGDIVLSFHTPETNHSKKMLEIAKLATGEIAGSSGDLDKKKAIRIIKYLKNYKDKYPSCKHFEDITYCNNTIQISEAFYRLEGNSRFEYAIMVAAGYFAAINNPDRNFYTCPLSYAVLTSFLNINNVRSDRLDKFHNAMERLIKNGVISIQDTFSKENITSLRNIEPNRLFQIYQEITYYDTFKRSFNFINKQDVEFILANTETKYFEHLGLLAAYVAINEVIRYKNRYDRKISKKELLRPISFLSHEAVAKKIGVTEKTAKGWIDELVDLNVLAAIKGFGLNDKGENKKWIYTNFQCQSSLYDYTLDLLMTERRHVSIDGNKEEPSNTNKQGQDAIDRLNEVENLDISGIINSVKMATMGKSNVLDKASYDEVDSTYTIHAYANRGVIVDNEENLKEPHDDFDNEFNISSDESLGEKTLELKSSLKDTDSVIVDFLDEVMNINEQYVKRGAEPLRTQFSANLEDSPKEGSPTGSSENDLTNPSPVSTEPQQSVAPTPGKDPNRFAGLENASKEELMAKSGFYEMPLPENRTNAPFVPDDDERQHKIQDAVDLEVYSQYLAYKGKKPKSMKSGLYYAMMEVMPMEIKTEEDLAIRDRKLRRFGYDWETYQKEIEHNPYYRYESKKYQELLDLRDGKLDYDTWFKGGNRLG